MSFTSREISAKYDRFASWYDWLEGIPDVLGLRGLRRRVLRKASGRVLEAAIGTGKNLRYYGGGCRITGVDLSAGMLNLARRRAMRLSMEVEFLRADAEALPFSDRSFDTVVSSLSTCTFPDPVRAIRELARVCRPDGRILLLEHGRSDRQWLGRWQDKTARRHAESLGCHWNRETLELVERAGLDVAQAQRTFFGVFHEIEARPPSAGENLFVESDRGLF